jgi:hypothetical protein
MDSYKVNVPVGMSGCWEVKKVTVSPADAERELLRAKLTGSKRGTPEGEYTMLTCAGEIIMSDTPDEYADHAKFIKMAKGNVLINGLGLGMALQAVAEKDSVTHITVIEKSEDVIALVGNHYCSKYGDKVTIINADAYTFELPKSEHYDVVWHDIWPSICISNVVGMKRLYSKYNRKVGWQRSWCQYECQKYVREYNILVQRISVGYDQLNRELKQWA